MTTLGETTIVTKVTLESGAELKIGETAIPASDVLYVSPHSFVVKCATPLVPSHVLVFPKRVIGDSTELPEEEYLDLHQTCTEVGSILKAENNGEGVSIFSNDIVDSGVPLRHTYFNVMSRTPSDASQNDHFYDITELRSMCPLALQS